VLSATLGITDSIIVSHSVGISQSAGSVREDYSLFFGNGNNLVGIINIGAHNLNHEPGFVAPAADNYHLGPHSAAIDQGINSGVAFDVDGQAREIPASAMDKEGARFVVNRSGSLARAR